MEKDHFEDPDVDWTMIIKWIFKKKDGVCMDGTDLAQNRDERGALVNMVMNFRVS